MESDADWSGNSSSLRTLMFNDKIDTPNLGDFLRVKEDNNNHVAGLTLGAVLSNKRECSSSSSPSLVQSNRTLLDIIRDDPNMSSRKTRKTNWKHFRNKLRLKPDISIQRHNNPIISPPHHVVENFDQPSGSRSGNAEEEESEGENAREEIQPARMSLMALLTENDGDGSAYMIGDGDDEDDEDHVVAHADADADAGASVGVGTCGEYNNCCVCMVRHKGAAFIPCGHTFCRLCSRELWVQRGNCPLCNNFILEVLDIF
ncbi:hypothetical protein K7X08_005017 [Anisodus acutangulus]|uniref:RING-type domain-containing protein n=1 Tax=Anisodus acutangulus TaxID=402998 RepID=A0A9Q1MEQ3_9SOLA|nr:hypothetical protein K7X08_005017 [Anisodus acutangulus]